NANASLAGLGHRLEYAGTYARQQRDAIGSAFLCVDRRDRRIIDIRLELSPPWAGRAAAAGTHLADIEAAGPHDFDLVTHAERDALKHRPDQARAVMPHRQADPRPAGVGNRIWTPLAGQVWQENQALTA